MIENPSEKDEIYLANVAKIGDSIENIIYIEDVLSQEEHNLIINFVKNYNSWVRQPWGATLAIHDDIPKEIIEMLEKVFTIVYQKSSDVYNVDINPLDKNKINLMKFLEGFHLPPHIDTLSAELNHIASIYYINDDYTGGEITFPDFDLKIKPKPNSVIIFPGNENYLHQVVKIFGGDRYSATTWFQFTGSNFNKKSEWYGNLI